MNVAAVLTDAVDRVSSIVHAVTTDLDADGLSFRPDDSSNSIAWLLWHTARCPGRPHRGDHRRRTGVDGWRLV